MRRGKEKPQGTYASGLFHTGCTGYKLLKKHMVHKFVVHKFVYHVSFFYICKRI